MTAKMGRQRFAEGGNVEIKVSDGEFLVPPEKVAELGEGDVDYGHKILDEFVQHARQQSIKHLASLPPPRDSGLDNSPAQQDPSGAMGQKRQPSLRDQFSSGLGALGNAGMEIGQKLNPYINKAREYFGYEEGGEVTHEGDEPNPFSQIMDVQEEDIPQPLDRNDPTLKAIQGYGFNPLYGRRFLGMR